MQWVPGGGLLGLKICHIARSSVEVVIPGDAGHRILVGEADHYFDSNFGTAAFQIKHLRVTFSRTVFGGGSSVLLGLGFSWHPQKRVYTWQGSK